MFLATNQVKIEFCFEKYQMIIFSKCDSAIKFKSPITGQYQTVNAHRLSFMAFKETMDISGMDVTL